MATITTPKAPPTKPKKDRERERREKLPPVSERLKTVVRRLPPNLPEEVFWQSVDAWVTDETITWKIFYPGKFRKRLNKENIPSRAYIAFKTEDQLALFSKDYDGHLFRDKAGNEAQAVVEFAPYQKIPAEKKKPDARNATIEKDEDYISFLASLNAATNSEPVTLETLIAASQPPPPPKTTPLLEALKAEKSANKDKEAILRNHAHYKDQASLGSGSTPRKDELKKKGPPGQKQAEVTPGGKKHKKTAPVPTSAGQKPPPINTTPKNTNTAGPSSSTLKSPKISRPPRPPPQAKIATGGSKSTAPSGNAPLVPPVVDATVPTSSQQSNVAAAPPRRTRPVIGLASRQFEAALSGAGVGATSERKPRREKERERDKEREISGTGNSGPTESKPTPPSPRRDRGGRHKDPNPASGGTGGGSSSVKVPSILQRSDAPPPAIMQRDPPRIDASANIGPPTILTDGAHLGGGAGRGNRRGRGRGRGGPTRGG